MEADLSAERTKYESQKWERNGIADDMNELKARYFEMKKKETEDEELKNAGYSEFANKELKDIPMEDLDAKLKEFNIGFGNW